MKACCDTSPLILLDKVSHLWILEKLFGEIIIPSVVNKEWLRPSDYKTPNWIKVHHVSSDFQVIIKRLSTEIDEGEAEAITLCKEMNIRLLVIDDLKGRKRAKTMGLKVIGTGGVLVEAKRRGLILHLKPILDELIKARYRIDDRLYRFMLSKVEESS